MIKSLRVAIEAICALGLLWFAYRQNVRDDRIESKEQKSIEDERKIESLSKMTNDQIRLLDTKDSLLKNQEAEITKLKALLPTLKKTKK